MLLHKAVQENDIAEVKKLLEDGADVNAKDKRGNTVLHLVQDNDIASLLLSSSSDLNVQNDDGDTPLHIFCLPLIGHLSDLKTNTICIRQEILEMFLEAGASPNIQNHLGYSVLHSIFVYGGIAGIRMDIEGIREIVTLLLKYSANVNLRDFEGCTPLHQAVREPSMASVVELLLAEANVNARDGRGMTPLHHVFDLDDEDMVKLLLCYGSAVNEKDINGSTVVSSAALVGNEFLLELLLSDPRADVNLGDLNGITPLHLAAAYKRIGVCEMLVAHAADVNALDAWNASPLHYAAYGGTPEIITLLLRADADHKIKDGMGYLPIQYALDRHYFHTAIAFGDEYQQEVQAYLSNMNQTNGATDVNLEDQILQSYPADDVLTMIVPASKVYKNPYNAEILPPDTLDYIKMKTHNDSSAFVRGMIEVPGIGRIPDNEDARDIRIAVETYIEKLISIMAEIDPRLCGSLLCSGSVYEGTKICDPYEFDYMLCLEKFEQICSIQLDERTQFDNVQVSKVKSFVGDSFVEFFHEDQLQSDKVMTVFVEVARKAISHLNFATGSRNLYFQSLTEHTLVEATWILPGTVTCNLKLIWNGPYYKQLVICVDLVPAIHIRDWPRAAIKESCLLTDNFKSKGCHVVSKAGYWRLSFSLAEKMIMEGLSNEQKLAFIGAKVMLHSAVSAKITIYDDSVLYDVSNISDLDNTNMKPDDDVIDTKQEYTTDATSSRCTDKNAFDAADRPFIEKHDANRDESIGTRSMEPTISGTMVGRMMSASGPVTVIKVSDKRAMLSLEVSDRVDISVIESHRGCDVRDRRNMNEVREGVGRAGVTVRESEGTSDNYGDGDENEIPRVDVTGGDLDLEDQNTIAANDDCSNSKILENHLGDGTEVIEGDQDITTDDNRDDSDTPQAVGSRSYFSVGEAEDSVDMNNDGSNSEMMEAQVDDRIDVTERDLDNTIDDDGKESGPQKVGARIDIAAGEAQDTVGVNDDGSNSDIPAKTIEPRDVLSTYLLKMLFFHCLEENMTNSPGTIVTTEQIFEHLCVCLKEKLPLPYYFMQGHNLMDKVFESEDLRETELVVMMLNTFFKPDTLQVT